MDPFISLDSRRSERPLVELAAVAQHPRSGRRFTAEVVELSCEGCRLLAGEGVVPGDQLLVSVAGLADWPARVVWATSGAVGLEFHQPLLPEAVARYAESFPPDFWVQTESLRLTAAEPIRWRLESEQD